MQVRGDDDDICYLILHQTGFSMMCRILKRMMMMAKMMVITTMKMEVRWWRWWSIAIQYCESLVAGEEEGRAVDYANALLQTADWSKEFRQMGAISNIATSSCFLPDSCEMLCSSFQQNLWACNHVHFHLVLCICRLVPWMYCISTFWQEKEIQNSN